MKKLLCLLLTLAMMLSLAACGSKADDKTPEEDDPTQAETPVDDKQDEPAADDADKDNASDATEIEPDANKGEKPNEAQKPAEPTKSDSKKDETPASKPSEPAKPAEPSKPAETPSETPAAQDTGALSLLTSVWSTYSEDDKFPAAGGDAEHSVDGAPGSFDVSNADSLTYQLIEGVVEEQSENLRVTEEQKKFIADFYKYSFVGVMLDWIKRGMKEAPEEIANMVCVTMHGNIGNSLRNMEINYR